MKKIVTFLFLICILFCFSQETVKENLQATQDSIVYTKNTDIANERTFKSNLKDKYSGNKFIYIEENEKNKSEKKVNSSTKFYTGLLFFMSNIFPFLLGLIVVFIILKTFLGADTEFWSLKKRDVKTAEKLTFEEENIIETDYNKLLIKSIEEKNYRLAIRYYYLSLLNLLSHKKYIKYNKEKTNSDYLFELKNTELRNQFSYLSYIYNYVWYGEFPINEDKFKSIETRYKSFTKIIN